jgi:hypothetical protein
VEPFFIEFEVTDPERFDRLVRLFDALAHDKAAGALRSDDDWLALCDERALERFQPSNPDPEAWDLGSLIEAFSNGEYRLIACRMVSERLARLEYDPYAGPFGGTECMKVLIRAFDGRVTRDYWEESTESASDS